MPEPRDAAIARQRLVIDALVESRLAGSAGDMTECQAHEVASLVDRAVLWPLLRAEHDRLHSWAGLMSLLDGHWPDAVFRGTSGDPGPTIVFLLRQVDQLKAERARVQVEAVELRESLERMTERSDGWQGDANRYGGELDDLRRIVGEYFGIEITDTASLPEEVRALIAKAARAERQCSHAECGVTWTPPGPEDCPRCDAPALGPFEAHPTLSDLQVAPEVGDQLLDMGTPWAEGGEPG